MTANSKLSDFSYQTSAGKKKRSLLGFTLKSLLRPIRRSCKGFTLIELMVAIAIIAILGSVGLVMFTSAQKAGRISKRVQDLNALKTALELYKSAVGNYPPATGSAGNFACIGAASGGLTALVPNYMPVLPADPLDAGNAVSGTNCYEYTSNSTTAATSNEYKIRTKAAVYGSTATAEMQSTAFNQQPSLIDPTKDSEASSNCNIVPSPGPVMGWAVYSGSTGCSYP